MPRQSKEERRRSRLRLLIFMSLSSLSSDRSFVSPISVLTVHEFFGKLNALELASGRSFPGAVERQLIFQGGEYAGVLNRSL